MIKWPVILLCAIAPILSGASVPSQVFNIPILIRYGNFLCPGLPDKPPTFIQPDLIGRNPKYLDHKRSVKPFIEGNYYFRGRTGARQVIWIADSLVGDGLNLTVSGFAFGAYPRANTPSQSLTIMGVPGKVFISADQNNGSYTVTIRR